MESSKTIPRKLTGLEIGGREEKNRERILTVEKFHPQQRYNVLYPLKNIKAPDHTPNGLRHPDRRGLQSLIIH